MSIKYKTKNEYYEEENIIIQCACGCEDQLCIRKYIDNDTAQKDYYIILSSGKFYSEQKGIFKIIKNRLKNAFLCLTGKSYRLFDINIKEADLIDFRNKISEIINDE